MEQALMVKTFLANGYSHEFDAVVALADDKVAMWTEKTKASVRVWGMTTQLATVKGGSGDMLVITHSVYYTEKEPVG